MIQITTQKQLRDLRNPGFCYICGAAFGQGERSQDEHVIPKSLFGALDRTPPFILLAHPKCNSDKSRFDEPIGQMMKLLRGEMLTDRNKQRLSGVLFEPTGAGSAIGGVEDFDFDRILLGWIKGFHTLLYRQYLPHAGKAFAFTAPWPSFRGTPPAMEPPHPAHRMWVAMLRANRRAMTIDSVRANNHKLRYECFWDHLDNGRPCCVFALDVDGWTRLSDRTGFPPRSCVGVYESDTPTPAQAARGTRLVLPVISAFPDDAFAD